MNRLGFWMGFGLVVWFFYVMFRSPTPQASIDIPVNLKNISCKQSDAKHALVNFNNAAIYQLCMIPSNVKNGVKNNDIIKYFTTPHVDCRQQNQMCEELRQVVLFDDNQYQVYIADDIRQVTINSLLRFSRVDNIEQTQFVKPLQGTFELSKTDLRIPTEMTIVSPVICTAFPPKGMLHIELEHDYVDCTFGVEKFGEIFRVTYVQPMSKEMGWKPYQAVSELKRWLAIMDNFIVRNEKVN